MADQLEPVDLEAQLFAHRTQPVDVALAVAPEVEVLADDHRTGVQCVGEDLAHEVVGGGERSVVVEVHDIDHVDTVDVEQLELLVERHEDLGCVLGPQHQRRVDVEGHDRRQHVADLGLGAQVAQHVLVTEVDAVEGADGHDAALARPRAPDHRRE